MKVRTPDKHLLQEVVRQAPELAGAAQVWEKMNNIGFLIKNPRELSQTIEQALEVKYPYLSQEKRYKRAHLSSGYLYNLKVKRRSGFAKMTGFNVVKLAMIIPIRQLSEFMLVSDMYRHLETEEQIRFTIAGLRDQYTRNITDITTLNNMYWNVLYARAEQKEEATLKPRKKPTPSSKKHEETPVDDKVEIMFDERVVDAIAQIPKQLERIESLLKQVVATRQQPARHPEPCYPPYPYPVYPGVMYNQDANSHL